MIFDVNWPALAAMTTIVVMLSGAVFLLLRARLANDFVTRRDHDQVLERLRGIEQRLSNIPQHTDLIELERRVGEVARNAAATHATVQALSQALGRIEHQLNMLIEAKLTEERG